MTTPETSLPRRRRAGQALVLAAIVLLAFNLRPAAVSVGPVLDEVRRGLGMSSTVAGVLTSLPVVAFAVFGALAPRLAATVGPHRVTLLSLVTVGGGLLARSRVDQPWSFLLLSLVALAGMATANVVLPSLVKQHFPTRIGLVTGIYSTALAVGLTSASVLTVPIADATGSTTDGWRTGLATWAFTGLVAAIPWVLLVTRDRRSARPDEEPGPTIGLGDIARTRLGRRMALLFGLQSLMAYSIFGWFADVYRDAGFSATEAGVLLGVITGITIPLSLVVPLLTARLVDLRPVLWPILLCYPVGYLGLVVAPVSLAYLWAAVIGIGTTTFPLVLTLIGLRARTATGTAALSGFAQSVGYVIAAAGPFLVGLVHDVSGGWTLPLLLLTALVAPLTWVALKVAPPQHVEDELGHRQARP